MARRRRTLLALAGLVTLPALRAMLTSGLCTASLATAGAAAAAGAAVDKGRSPGRVPTPSQPEGPFYPRSLPADHDEDLVSVTGRPQPAKGTVLHLLGTVSGDDGDPLDGAVVEIWQCDANGRYHHVDDGGGPERDPNFQGYGRTRTAADGGYRFRTIRPVPYPGRAPHIHLRVTHPRAVPLTTQMYAAGDSTAAESGYFRRFLGRERLTVSLVPAGDTRDPGSLRGRFDLVLALK